MARYEPRRLNVALPRPAAEKPRRLRRGAAEPRRLVSTPHRPPVVRLLLMAAALTTAAMMGGTAARYLNQWSNNGSLVTAESFYFASDKLVGDGSATYRETASGGNVVFTFTLKNFIVPGCATEKDIEYTCAVTDSQGPVTNVRWIDSDSTPITQGVTNGAISGTFTGKSEETRNMTCSIPVEDFEGDKVLTLTAAASSPYVKELTAKVVLAGDGEVRMVVTDKGGAVSVALFNINGTARSVKLSWPSTDLELVPDPTWETVLGLPLDATNVILEIPANQVKSVVFLKRTTERRYGESDFTAELQ